MLLGLLRDQELDPTEFYTGTGHAPPVLSDAEQQAGEAPDAASARDLPDWLWPRFKQALGPGAEAAAQVLRNRAPIVLRVNLRHCTRAQAISGLVDDGIMTQPMETAKSALQVTAGERKISSSKLFKSGGVELQDASSQAAVEAMDLRDGARVLDYCAGGGGKTLAMAALADCAWFAHDISVPRLADLPPRARRAGIDVEILDGSALPRMAPFNMVLCDAPCSGSGTWRRNPEAKWALTPERLRELTELQRQILSEAASLVAPGGRLIYTTCSILTEENQESVDRFLCDFPAWSKLQSRNWPISDQSDGFFFAELSRYS
ncbi:RsmB/NOP family class I SAM-dependent RNA methyltransferase [uncultured Roseovarius sp.]|uniref:RsmB/NOP family class I SAM-dependent RNA methyltransferase n=1 Tax=uncultured Roseovarius sp. TaxID=293344 RepID=UPI00342EA173